MFSLVIKYWRLVYSENVILTLIAGLLFAAVMLGVVPLVHWLAWWMPLLLFFSGIVFDDVSTFLCGLRYGGREKFANYEGNELVVKYVERFGLLGIFISNFSFASLRIILKVLAIFGWPTLILVPLGFARPYDIIAVPFLVLGCLKITVGTSNTVFLFHKHQLLSRFRTSKEEDR